jgi:hypothetical protein
VFWRINTEVKFTLWQQDVLKPAPPFMFVEMLKATSADPPQGTFSTQSGPALSHMIANRQNLRFPFGSLVPLLADKYPALLPTLLL